MSKMKTNKSVVKRFSKTASGKFKKGKTRRSHLMTCKSAKQKRGFRKQSLVDSTDAKRFAVLIPYL